MMKETAHPQKRMFMETMTEEEVRCRKCGAWYFLRKSNGISIRPCPDCGEVRFVSGEAALKWRNRRKIR